MAADLCDDLSRAEVGERMSERVKVPPQDNSPKEVPGDAATRRETMLLLLGTLAGPTWWFVHQQVSGVLVWWICEKGRSVAWLHAATGVCLIGAAAAGVVAWGVWRRAAAQAAQEANDTRKTERQRAVFMGKLGVLLSVFFALVIIAQAIPNFLLDPCQR